MSLASPLTTLRGDIDSYSTVLNRVGITVQSLSFEVKSVQDYALEVEWASEDLLQLQSHVPIADADERDGGLRNPRDKPPDGVRAKDITDARNAKKKFQKYHLERLANVKRITRTYVLQQNRLNDIAKRVIKALESLDD